jgi:hypothetical protein
LPANAPTDHSLITDNADGSVTIYFVTLDDLLANAAKVSAERTQPISVLNVHGHGMPGGMWFPKDAAEYDSLMCWDWRRAAEGADEDNYRQYYSAVSKDEVMQIRQMGENAEPHFACVTGLSAWRAAVAKLPAFKAALASDAQVHFLSCVVGLGKAGENFTRGLADLLFASGSKARVETSTNFGLGDWSMPEGMGFWDYLSDDQIERDAVNYPAHRQDREVAQKGTIRVALSGRDTSLLSGRDFMSLAFEPRLLGTPVVESFAIQAESAQPSRVRVPGTNVYVSRIK